MSFLPYICLSGKQYKCFPQKKKNVYVMRGWHYGTEVVKFICQQEDGDAEEQLGPQTTQTADVQTQR